MSTAADFSDALSKLTLPPSPLASSADPAVSPDGPLTPDLTPEQERELLDAVRAGDIVLVPREHYDTLAQIGLMATRIAGVILPLLSHKDDAPPLTLRPDVEEALSQAVQILDFAPELDDQTAPATETAS